MARKDLIEVYLKQQNVYLEMLENTPDLEVARREGILTEEQVAQATKDIEAIRNEYERWSYTIMLLNQPKRKSKKAVEYRQNKALYDALSGVSREAILDESKDALADLKKLLKLTKASKSESKE